MKQMNWKKIIAGTVLTSFATLALAGCGVSNSKNAQTQEKVIIQLSSSQSLDSIAGQSAMRIKELVEGEIGSERVEIQFFSDGQLGKDTAILEGMAMGTYDALIVGPPVTNVDSKYGIFDMPYLMTDEEDIKALINGEVGEELTASIVEKGYINTGYLFAGWRHLTNNIRPVATPADMKGIKIRVTASPSREKLFRLMGANPTPLSFGELFSALQQGVVDGQENPLYVLTVNAFKDVQKYVSLSKHSPTVYSVLFSQEKWDTYPEDIQQAILKAVQTASEESFTRSEELDQSVLKEVEGLVEINEVDLAAFEAVANELYTNPEFVDPIGQELLDKALQAVGKE